MRWWWSENGAGRVDVVIRGVGVLVVAGVLAGGGAYVVNEGGGEEEAAHAWVNTDTSGDTCTRSGSLITFEEAESNGWLCESFNEATTAANTGDTVRVKAGTYGMQGSIGHASKVLTFIGEDGAIVDSGSTNAAYSTFNLSGNVTVDNVDVTGDYPILMFSGDSNTYKNATVSGREARTCSPSSDEPVLLQDGDSGQDEDYTITNTLIQDVVIEDFFASDAGAGGCPGDDAFHLEQVRIGGGVDGLILDRVTFGNCGDVGAAIGCYSGQVFFTVCPSPCAPPRNITIQNSKFYPSGNSHMQNAALPASDLNHTFAYNTFTEHEPYTQTALPQGIHWIGNIGQRPQNCLTGQTFVKNVWQWSGGSPCGTDTLITDDQSIDQLGINATTLDLESGSPGIDAAETPGASDYCTDELGSVDHGGDERPAGSVCDAGADERE